MEPVATKDETLPDANLPTTTTPPSPRLFLLLHHISKRQNARTLLTSAAAFGAEVLVVGQPGFDELSHVPKRLAAAFAAVEREGESTPPPFPLYRRFVGTLEECRDHLHAQNVQVWGIEIGQAAVNVEEAPWDKGGGGGGGVALLLGNEGSGMSARQARVCDGFVYISQYGQVRFCFCFYLPSSLCPSSHFPPPLPLLAQGTASLNVAVAGSIVMHRYSMWVAQKRQQRENESGKEISRP